MRKNKIKILLSLFFFSFLATLLVFSLSGPEVGKVYAGAEDNVSGYAWSENIGWISFNCTDREAATGKTCVANVTNSATQLWDYGVKINNDGTFSGYTWSENIGWISFNQSELSGCPSGTCKAEVDLSSHEVSGWARALAHGGGWDGWIRLRGSNYGVKINNATQEFEGWAWGDDVVGWISFNDITGGGPVDYKVMTSFTFNRPPDKPQPVGEGETWHYCWSSPQVALGTSIAFNWTYSDPEGDLQQEYEIWVDENSSFSGSKFNYIAGINSTSYALDLGQDQEGDWLSKLAWSTTYWWKVRVKDTESGQWSEWSDPNSFTMNDHANPYPDFIWSPSPPSADAVTQFCAVQEPGICSEDKSTCYNASGAIPSPSCSGKSFLWSFSPNTVEYATGTSPTSKNPRVKFATSDSYSVTLQITDDIGTCSITKQVNVTFPLPEWEESAP